MMKRLISRIVGAGCLAVMLAAPVVAQEDTGSTNRDLELAEDMEIMGGLLEEALETAYQQPGVSAIGSVIGGFGSGGNVSRVIRENSNQTRELVVFREKSNQTSELFSKPLSSYLEGHGIVFQTEAPLPRQVEGGDSGASKRDECPFLTRSPWERMQLRVQSGNPSGAKETCQKCHDPASTRAHWFLSRPNGGSYTQPTREQLVDTLLQVLAENGHNVWHLKPEERITLALTFRLDENADTVALREKQEDTLTKQLDKALRQPHAIEGNFADERVFHFNTWRIRDSQPLAGDLLLNTRQYNKAITSYQKALESVGVKDLFQHTPDAGQRRIYRQLLQAHVGAGNLDKAQKLIAILRAGEVKATPDKKSPPPLPSRLVVSATKAQLDQVAGGEMSREEFAKQAKVQFLEGRSTEPSKQAKGDWKSLIDPITGGILFDAAQRDTEDGRQKLIDPKTGGILYDRRDSVPVPKSPRKR